MGAKYTTQTQTGYNSSPPPDDGSVQASNKVSWATMVKAKIGDPVLTLAQAINSALVTFTNFGSRAVTGTDSIAAADHMKSIEGSNTYTETLPDAATVGAGFIVTVKNSGTGAITVNLTTITDTIDTVANATYKIQPKCIIRFKVNSAANGYIIDSCSPWTTDSNGGAACSGTVSVGAVRTAAGATASIASGAATTIVALTGSTAGRYSFFAYISGGSSSVYLASAIVHADDNSHARITSDNGANMTITLSGLNVQVTQTSGSNAVVTWRYTLEA